MTLPRLGLIDRCWLAAAGAAAIWASVALLIATPPVGNLDVWWVAAAGRDFLSSGHLPATNAWSFTDPNHPWVMHEWLYAAPFAWGVKAVGPAFFGIVTLFFSAATLALVLRAQLSRPEHPELAFLTFVVTLFLYGERLLIARPTNLSLLFPVAMATLAFGSRFGRWHGIGAVALEVLWANAHGSFPLGIALLVASAVCEREHRRARWAAAGAALVGTLANPYGLRLHGLLLGYLLGADGIFRVVHEQVREFRPVWNPPSGLESEWLFHASGLAVAALLAIATLPDRRFRPRAVVCLAGTALASLQVRNVDAAGLVTLVLLGPHLGDVFSRFTRAAPSSRTRRAWIAAVVFPGVAAGVVAAVASRRLPLDVWLTGRDPAAASFLRLAARLPPGARVYPDFLSSGLLVWTEGPRGVKVFYDLRNDCYSESVARDFFDVRDHRVSADEARSILERYGTQFALVADDEFELPGWSQVATEGPWKLWAR